ncbi:DUF3152 domain-containing protein [Streptomyces sp. PSKA28]|uniref:DUF3152 domain-containing protein n=3 Tax=Streptomyces TaxID=1883 RepID=A0A7W0DFZ9_9ACTN|nr:DUF3152 domain-containing protein [Streptomyces himalayensis subsp. himalayensis]
MPDGTPARGVPRMWDGTPARGVPRLPDGTPAHGVPRAPDGTPAGEVPRVWDGTPARGVPRLPDGTPAHGVPRGTDGTPARGVPRIPEGTPPNGVPRMWDGTPAHGVPRIPDGAPAHDVPHVRGGHPEGPDSEPGGGWGARGGGPRMGASYAAPVAPAGRRIPGPRKEYVDAFADDDVFAPRSAPMANPAASPTAPAGPNAPVTDWRAADDVDEPTTFAPGGPEDPDGLAGPNRAKDNGGGKGRALAGVAAAAVTTVLAVVVVGQVTAGHDTADTQTQAADAERGTDAQASRSDGRATPSRTAIAVPATYAQKMSKKYALDPQTKGSGKFAVVAGFDKAPGTGQLFRYRVDVERGLGLDGALFAQAVQKTLNDDRSWAHNGGRTFERVSSGKVDFVITLASPGTTGVWCAKSGLDTTEDNVSCDSAATERVMINAYRWAQGARTYGDRIYAYRQMLINHEVGHRLGFNHVTCSRNGALAPVMQQQTKFLTYGGITCKANPWPYPGN